MNVQMSNDAYSCRPTRSERPAAPVGDVVHRAVEALAARGMALADAKVLVVGVASRPGRADVRDSPALETIDRMRRAGTSVSFTDELVGRLRVTGGRLSSVQPGDLSEWDLVVVHTRHPGADPAWLAGAPALLDASAAG
jgi:UDP-N-acetyl-D-mannosaminuronate dehydrogenase